MMFLRFLGGRSGLIFAAFACLILVAGGGMYIGSQMFEKRQLENQLRADERAKEIEDEVDDLDDDGLIDGILQPD